MLFSCIHEFDKDACVFCGQPEGSIQSMPTYVIPAGRADSQELKRKLLDRIFECWTRTPELRLGQLIENARHEFGDVSDLFYLEDDALGHALECFVQKTAPR